eukprot:gnl/TRDRNA2_/TRDRNA2_56006_c1_seq1.p1 gnl/TRDRNA2_/TRDRNA2_56006_c1~~gnl/TRDRNA2_/TRDRNA2_56006_c1_seq1.p1  ORF type:complete len:570 (+),score=92.42 gnl/TRDRNA2_/TRDRNA2_56006_c1_seq1:1-1710(+)
MTVPPMSGVWMNDTLTRHPLVLKMVAHYLRNSLDAFDEDEAQRMNDYWKMMGCPMKFFQEGGSFCDARAILDMMAIIDTPPGAPQQERHRDTYMPGPAAAFGMHIPLTPLQLEPLNAAIGITPESHRYCQTRGSNYRRDVLGVVPQGSVILYDSFVEHHGLENDSDDPRAALFAFFSVPGVYAGHSDENFGPPGLKETTRWRRHIEELLLPAVMASRGVSRDAELVWGFPIDREIIDWGEDRVCFRCDRTTGEGSLYGDMWFCDKCWAESRAKGGPGSVPQPLPWNAEKPRYKPDDYTEEQQLRYEGQKIVKANHGRHKLALIRERGHYLPIDPTTEWLKKKLDRDPQPRLWKVSIKTALGELPRGLDDPLHDPNFEPPVQTGMSEMSVEDTGSKYKLADPERRFDLLPNGAVVIIASLSSRPDLQGKLATVVGYDADQQHYLVNVRDTGETASLNASNCQHVVFNVRIKGLVVQPELNGVGDALVFEFEQLSGSFKVQVTSQKMVLSLPPENIELPSGTSVEIMGVQSRPELNGRRGKIVAFDADVGRYSVQMSAGEIKQLRPANVRP